MKHYDIPDSREEQLYDFYFLNYLYSKVGESNVVARYDPKPGFGDFDEYIRAAYKKLLNYLKWELLNAIFIAICAEFMHLRDMNRDPKLLSVSFLKNNPKWEKFMKVYLNSVMGKTDNYEYDERVAKVNSALRKAGMTEQEFISLASAYFNESVSGKLIKWHRDYGGNAWYNIAQAYINLNNAKSINDIGIYVDHVYDIQHNSGSVLDKVGDYEVNGSYAWIKNALDWKRDVKDLNEYQYKISAPLKDDFPKIMNFFGCCGG